MSVAAPTRPAEAIAQHESDCPLCIRRIQPGEVIRKPVVSLDWMHVGCAEDYAEVYSDDETGSPAGWED